MKTEFNLSEKIWEAYEGFEGNCRVEDVKEFIRLLKDEVKKQGLIFDEKCSCCKNNFKKLNKGFEIIDKLIK